MNRYLLFTFLFLLACTKPATTRSTSSNINRYEEDLSASRPKYINERSASVVNNSQVSQNKAASSSQRLDITQRLEATLDSIALHNKTIRYAQGYRIQIYAGSDRREAEQAKSTSYQLFPEITPYLLYIQPTYRVKAGDFLDRVEAEKYYTVYKASYPDAIVVPDKVDIKNTFSVRKK